jgi:hypothetical protein
MTDFEALPTVWHGQDDQVAPQRATELVAATGERVAALDRAVRRRDRIETVTALAMAPVFGVVAMWVPSRVSAVGAVVLAVACLFIPVWLRRARHAPPDPGLPVAARLAVEAVRLRAQTHLLQTVGWWYLLPLAVGAILVVVGGPIALAVKLLYVVVVLGFSGTLLVLNRRAATRHLAPIIQELERWVAEANRPEKDHD